MTPVDFASLSQWLTGHGFLKPELEPLQGDVSQRRYLRVSERGDSARRTVLAVYPETLEDACRRFSLTTRLLDEVGIRVPAIFAADCDAGLMLLEDLGPETLYERSSGSWYGLNGYLETALGYIGRLESIPSAALAQLSPALDGELLTAELDKTWDCFLAERSLSGESALQQEARKVLETLLAELDSAPRRPCHRDFMARNLVPVDAARELAVLDHQDLRLGPIGYDLASLLNDTLIVEPEQEDEILDRFCPASSARITYHRCAAQRMLKIVGTFVGFARQTHGGGSQRHLPLVAPSLARAADQLEALPEGGAFPVAMLERWRDPAVVGGALDRVLGR